MILTIPVSTHVNLETQKANAEGAGTEPFSTRRITKSKRNE